MYYRLCELCGATLDPEETCDCWLETESEDEKQLSVERRGGMTVLEALKNSNECQRITREVLSNLTGLSDRMARKEIHELRNQGYWIVGDTAGGGYYLANAREWDAFCDQQRRRAVNNFYRKSNEARVMEGQIRIV